MGNPNHYSLELPQRCLRLIDELLPVVTKIYEPGFEERGPLSSTFLISIAVPIIILPVERIERHKGPIESYADDRHINDALSHAITKDLGGRAFCKFPFFHQNAWSYAYYSQPDLNISRGLPVELRKQLGSDGARDEAESLPASKWCSILRNALAHGGVAYLDASGHEQPGNQADMFLFVSGKYRAICNVVKGTHHEESILIGVHCLRIKEQQFLMFLRRWVEWLCSVGVTELLKDAA